MPAPCTSVAGQERDWRLQTGTARFSILPEAHKMKGTDPDVKNKPEQKRMSSSPSPRTSNLRGNGNAAAPAESHTLKVDERLRLARERREEHLKQLASRERGWKDREERARRFYEKHLEERQRKVEEQRLREERRRNAVEEKRKQRLKQEKERYESVVQKTVDRSQKAKQRSTQRRVCNPKNNTNAKRRSLSQWEINLINRLQTPTISFLARSRSAACQSRGEASCHTMSSPQKPVATVTHSKTIRSGVKAGSHQSSGSKTKPQSHPVSVKICSISGTEDKTTSSVTGLTLRVSPSQECLSTLPEEEDPDLKDMQKFHQPQCDQSAIVSRQEEAGCDGAVQENLGSNRPLATPVHERSVRAQSRPSVGTTDPEEASRLLAVKRQQARQQREREIEEHRQREETEWQGQEELLHPRLEERERHEAETHCEVKRMMKEEEELKKVEEEKQQKEEEEEKQRLERETRFQREETERQERKKRLEEIMSRTRRINTEKKPVLASTPLDEHLKPLHGLPLEEVIQLPSPAKGSMMSLANEEDILPTVAFKERRSIRTLTGLEEIQAHQRAEVI